MNARAPLSELEAAAVDYVAVKKWNDGLRHNVAARRRGLELLAAWKQLARAVEKLEMLDGRE